MEKNKRYTLTITEEQANTLINALDLYQRIGMGQLEEIKHTAVPAPGHKYNWVEVDQTMAILKLQLLGWPHIGTAHSILSPDLPDQFRVAWDIQQVVRHRLAYDGLKPGEKPGIYVYFDEPRRTSKEPLPEIKQVEGKK